MDNRELIKTDKNGTKYFNTRVRCDRCGGDGLYKWGAVINGRPQFIGTCFKCNGAGHVWEIVKEYTPEYRAKLDAANEKRKAKQREKWEKERAEREKALAAERAKQEEERARRAAERAAEIERNRGHFIGTVGDKIEMTVTLARRFQYERPCYGAPWKTEYIDGYVFKTDDGNTLVYKTASIFGRKVYTETGHFMDKDAKGWYDYVHPEEGERMTIKGTIKAHEEYNNVNQTVLTRVRWVYKEVA